MTSPLPAPRAHSSTSAHPNVSVYTCQWVAQVTDASLLMEGKGKLILPIQPLDMTTHSLKNHAGGGPGHMAHTRGADTHQQMAFHKGFPCFHSTSHRQGCHGLMHWLALSIIIRLNVCPPAG